MTDHPCKGMTKAQIRDFELIAISEHPRGGYRTLDRLKARGLIKDGSPKQVGRDAFGPIMVPTWFVPLELHAQWCEWCSEQPGMEP